ncbi:MAG: type VII secretion protein EccCb, partial [Actinomycetota bacterium]|nr:type VII secretion protein EccCb [Actinomycetota bacterium]
MAPLCFAALMVAVMGRLVYALFALLGPVMALGTWLESRRRSGRTTKHQARQVAADMVRFGADLEHNARAELRRRWAASPHPAHLLQRAETPSTGLWERRRHHDDFLQLHAGAGDMSWQPALSDTGRTRPDEVDEVLAGASILANAPVPVDLSGGGVVGIVGERTAVLSVARSLVCQAATQSGPADLAVAVLTDQERVGDWDWAKWLPHAHQCPDDGEVHAGLLCADPETSDQLLRSLLSTHGGARSSGAHHEVRPVTMVVMDAEGLTEGRGSPARAVLDGQAGPVAGVVVAGSDPELPAVCSTVVELIGPHGEARLRRPQRGETVDRFLAAGIEEPVARRWARRLARFEDPESPGTEPGPPTPVTLTSVLDFDPCDPSAVARAWRTSADRTPVAGPVAMTSHGPITLDLRQHHHLLVTGGSGAGKSELLRSVVAGLAARFAPDRLTLLLIDGSGGGTFSQCALLPHVVGQACEADAGLGALHGLGEELEARGPGGGARPGESQPAPPPTLVVVIDDAAALTDRSPDVVDLLSSVASRGRALGVHLILATDRHAESLSRPFPGSATLALDRAGRGVGALGGPATIFQVPMVSGRAAATPDPVELAPFEFGPEPPPTQGTDGDFGRQGGGGDTAETDLAHIVAAVRVAFANEELDPPQPLWSKEPGADEPSACPGLAELLALVGVPITEVDAIDPDRTWRSGPEQQHLRVPIGLTMNHQPLCLDLKEAAVGGVGPHGLVVGATGSGKSELLRTLVSALAITHPPERLSFVLVDYKGGATFTGVAGLPHVAGMITNLEDDLTLVDRMGDALHGEQRRRQELLRRAGNLASVREYEQARASGADLEPLPSLLVIVDEFAELLTSRPDFIDLFVAIGRVGRSLGMHLLLASQRVDEGRLRGLDSHLSYRIGLRTFSALESRAVLGVADAHHLPPEPGGAFLKVGTDEARRFRTTFVSGPHPRPPAGQAQPAGLAPSVLDVVVSRLRHGAAPVHQVWLPPLPSAVTLDRVLPGPVDDPERGLVARGWPGVGRLAVPVGVVDKPREQAQHALVAELAGAEGNMAIVGAPQTGKSTLLRTMLASLLLTHTPEEVQIYCVDYGGGGLQALEEAPHVAAVAGRLDPGRVRRVVSEVEATVAGRERLFAERGIDSAATFRTLLAEGRLPGTVAGDVILVVDNWPLMSQTFDWAEAAIADVAARGLGFGVHTIITANQWMEIRPHLKHSFGGRLELRLSEPSDSTLDRRTAAKVPRGLPGRGLTKDGLQFQACLPRLDGQASEAGLQAATAELAARVRAGWPGAGAPPVRLLPEVLAFTDLPAPGADCGPGVPVGIGEEDLAPVYVDLTRADPHFLVLGDGESGKTTFLKAFLTGLTARFGPEQASVLVVDYRRGLLDAVHPGH